MNRTIDAFEKGRIPRRGLLLAAAGIMVGSLLTGCDNSSTESGRAELDKSWTPSTPSGLVFDGRIKYDGSEWPLNCYADGLKAALAEPGDTLLDLAHKAGTRLIQPANINFENIPADVFAVPLANINDLDNPDMIIAGETYEFPDSCRMG